MNRLIQAAQAAIVIIGCTFSAQALVLEVDSGEVAITNSQSWQKTTTTSSGDIAVGDSINLGAEFRATIHIDNTSRFLLKGPATAILGGDSANVILVLEEGNVFLDRNPPYEIPVSISSKGYSFEPIGTAAAVKTTRQGTPTTAVIRGKIRMRAGSGEAIEIGSGSFGSIDAAGKLTQGKLTARAISSLETWGNVSYQPPEPPRIASEQPADVTPATTLSPVDPVSPAAPIATPEPAFEPDASATEPAPMATTQPVPVPEPSMEQKPQPEPRQTPAPAVASVKPAPASAPAAKTSAADTPKEQPGDDVRAEKKAPEEKAAAAPAGPSTPTWEIGAGMVTVDNEQWTRLAIGVDVPIWKFGIFFDVELFINGDGQFSDKGWDFRDNTAEAITRKIRYIRFGQEPDPLFVKLGGLSNVTMGYGFIMDRFTNMLHYPDEKMIGLQFYLNDLTPIGLTLQTVMGDFLDLRNDGGVGAARLAVKPLSITSIPIVKNISVGATYALDRNQYAPAREWDVVQPPSVRQYRFLTELGLDSARARDTVISWGGDPEGDLAKFNKETFATTARDPFGLIGIDIGVPLITTSLLSLDLYAQAALRPEKEDSLKGWGFGAPGFALKIWRLWAGIEYRHTQGRFIPGHFGPYYYDERLVRRPDISTKEQRLVSDTLNGIFGRLGFNIANLLIIEGSYQYMIGKSKTSKDQRFEATSSIGEHILSKIPKLNRAEVYFYKTNIGSDPRRDEKGEIIAGKYDHFADKTPFLYYGYRAGFEITQGASLIWDSRFGYQRDSKGMLKSNNNVSVQTAITF